LGKLRTTTVASQTGLAEALFSRTQARVLGLVFGQPQRSFFASEIIALARSGSGAVQRELSRLESAGLVTAQRVGRQKHYQANARSPLFNELRSVIRKTVGLFDPLEEALRPVASRMTAAFVYGSVASRHDTAASDIDLMIISDELSYGEVFHALESTSRALGRPVNPTVYTVSDFKARVRRKDAFVTRVLQRPKLWLAGSDRDIAA
jgi:predicted nucleotidyltransferase